MYLSIATTHKPASDLGYLLMKHPARVHEAALPYGGRALLFYPECTEARAEATLILDLDPVALVRGKGAQDGLEDSYVSDRPYAASSFLSVALNKLLKSALSGTSRERQALAETDIPLVLSLAPVPFDEDFPAPELFEPLGWAVACEPIIAPDGRAPYYALTLSGTMRLSQALSHLYVLIPALDDAKHYWVGDDEVEKLVTRGGPWLATHPLREKITRRYLKHQRDLSRAALGRLSDGDAAATSSPGSVSRREEELEAPLRLSDMRMAAISDVLKQHGAARIADLGCGEGRLISALMKDRSFQRVVGVDVSVSALQRAARRLDLASAPAALRARIQLMQGSLTYQDGRWHDVDAAILCEVIEHVDPARLADLEACVFGAGVPLVVVTTPNADYNVRFPGLAAGILRHPDHRFEWGRKAFADWAARMGETYAYAEAISFIGAPDASLGGPTQMAAFSRKVKA